MRAKLKELCEKWERRADEDMVFSPYGASIFRGCAASLRTIILAADEPAPLPGCCENCTEVGKGE